MTVISTLSFDQIEIIENIIKLHCKDGFEVDPTYSKGYFYKDGRIPQPLHKFDLYPKTEDTIKASAENLPLNSQSIKSIMFDPPFLAGHTKEKPSGIIGERFHGFPYIADLWGWYELCLNEFYRVLENGGKLVFKCQDTVSSGKQYLSHVHIINTGEKLGFYTKDLFILQAKTRIIGHNHANQVHARKFHSYFIVFEKKPNLAR